MADPYVDLSVEHGAVLQVDPKDVIGYECDDQGHPDSPCRPFLLLCSGERKQLGSAVDPDGAADIIAAVKAKLRPE